MSYRIKWMEHSMKTATSEAKERTYVDEQE